MSKAMLKDYHVPNLVRALRIFELLSERSAGLTTAQITELLKVPRNSVFRITKCTISYNIIMSLIKRPNQEIYYQTKIVLHFS